jgi:hypothetical protein
VTPGVINFAACGGDGDGDGDVDLTDFAMFQACFGASSPACSAVELDGACGVTIGDLAPFVERLRGPDDVEE